MPQLPKPLLPQSLLNWIAVVLLVIASFACSQEDPIVLELRADAERTTAGGFPITFSVAHLPSVDDVIWRIDARSPGRLDSSSGNAVRYLPPGAGAIREEREIEVMAIAGDQTAHLKITLLPSDWSALTAGVGSGGELALLDR